MASRPRRSPGPCRSPGAFAESVGTRRPGQLGVSAGWVSGRLTGGLLSGDRRLRKSPRKCLGVLPIDQKPNTAAARQANFDRAPSAADIREARCQYSATGHVAQHDGSAQRASGCPPDNQPVIGDCHRHSTVEREAECGRSISDLPCCVPSANEVDGVDDRSGRDIGEIAGALPGKARPGKRDNPLVGSKAVSQPGGGVLS
jgi:hypothetical protein